MPTSTAIRQLTGLLLSLLLAVPTWANASLDSATVHLIGARLEVGHELPSPYQVSINTPVLLSTRLVDGSGVPLGAASLALGSELYVAGKLSGSGVSADESGGGSLETGVVELDPVLVGEPLVVPPLARAGNYVVSDLRLTDA